jgi:hypothetical protein
MSIEERARVLEITGEEAKGKVPIIVGTGTINPHSVVALTRQALDMGADARSASAKLETPMALTCDPYYSRSFMMVQLASSRTSDGEEDQP